MNNDKLSFSWVNRLIFKSGNYFLFAQLTNKKYDGFSLLEVLITILVTTVFLLTSLQATILATFLKIQAQDKQEATNWIQQDLELIKYQGFLLDRIGTSYMVNTTSCTNSTYGTRLRDVIIARGYPANASITINAQNYRVYRQYTLLGNILQVSYILAYAPTIATNSAHPRYKSNASYNLAIGPISGNLNIVSTLSTEILPNAALSCTNS